jgi:hypothetical protein
MRDDLHIRESSATAARQPPGAVLNDSRTGRRRSGGRGVPRQRTERTKSGQSGKSVEQNADVTHKTQESGNTTGDSCVRQSAGTSSSAPADAVPGIVTGGDGSATTSPAVAPARPDEVAMTRTLDAYAIRLAALKAYDITGVRPRELQRYRVYGEVPQGLTEEIVQRAQQIVEEERARLLRLAGS